MAITLTEKKIEYIIEEAVLRLIQENLKGQMVFGVKGNIPLTPAVELCNDVNPNVLAKCDDGSRSIPRNKIGDPQYFGGTRVWDAFEKYSNAISRRADLGRTPVSFFIFLNKIRNGWKGSKLEMFEKDGNYLLGISKMGVFLCIYICPKTAGVGMFKFIKDVCEYDNVVFAVTDDMGSMLERLGCPKYSDKVMAKFRGKQHEKMVYGSTQSAADTGAKILGMMGNSDNLTNTVKHAFKTNPSLHNLYQQNPKVVLDLMKQPIIMNFLAENPKIVEDLLKNPQILQSFSDNPVFGFLNFLKSIKNQNLHSIVNEIIKNEKRNIL